MIVTELDHGAILALFRPDGRWVRECGSRVKGRRVDLSMTTQELADRCGARQSSIYRIETGQFVPSDRLRALIAYHLDSSPELLWPFPSRDELEVVSQAAIRRRRRRKAATS